MARWIALKRGVKALTVLMIGAFMASAAVTPAAAASNAPPGKYVGETDEGEEISFSVDGSGNLTKIKTASWCVVWSSVSQWILMPWPENNPAVKVSAGVPFKVEWKNASASGASEFELTGIIKADGTASGEGTAGMDLPSLPCVGESFTWAAKTSGASQPFADVPAGHKFAREINWMYSTGLSTGVKQPSGKPIYAPKDRVSREAMAAFLYRASAPSGYIPPAVSPFSDVSKSHKFYKEIAWMHSSGLSTGIKQPSGKPKYMPKNRVSREAMAAFIYRLEGGSRSAAGPSPFADVRPGQKFYREIAWMYDQKLSTGVRQPSGKPKYLPKNGVSREAMAAFLYRLKN